MKKCSRNSTFRAKFFRREVSSSSRSLPTNSRTKGLRSKRRISLVFSTHFHSYQPSFAIIDSNYRNYYYRNYKRKVKYFMGYDKGERLKMSRKINLVRHCTKGMPVRRLGAGHDSGYEIVGKYYTRSYYRKESAASPRLPSHKHVKAVKHP